MEPLVSVVIPTYDRAALLPRAIASVASQTYPRWEIILVDDGSTDGTPKLAKKWRQDLGGRFVYVPRPRAGASAARNAGIQAARGDFVAFLDSDDEFLPSKLELQLSLFFRRPQLGFVYSDYSFVDFDGVSHASAFDQKFPLARQVESEGIVPGLRVCTGSLFDTLIQGYFIATITGMVRREALGDDVRFDPDIQYAEEWLFYLQVARRCACGFVDEPLARHHFVKNSLARESRQRNHQGVLQLLQRADRLFAGQIAAGQRRSLRDRMAAAARQIAYDAHAAGRPMEAARRFVEAFQYRGVWGLEDLARGATCSAAALLRRPTPLRPSRPKNLGRSFV